MWTGVVRVPRIYISSRDPRNIVSLYVQKAERIFFRTTFHPNCSLDRRPYPQIQPQWFRSRPLMYDISPSHDTRGAYGLRDLLRVRVPRSVLPVEERPVIKALPTRFSDASSFQGQDLCMEWCANKIRYTTHCRITHCSDYDHPVLRIRRKRRAAKRSVIWKTQISSSCAMNLTRFSENLSSNSSRLMSSSRSSAASNRSS